jgi:hypothetical protein
MVHVPETSAPSLIQQALSVQDAAAAAGDAGLAPQLWAALLRAHSLLPPLPADAASSFRDDSQHEASTTGAPPPAALSLQVRRPAVAWHKCMRQCVCDVQVPFAWHTR